MKGLFLNTYYSSIGNMKLFSLLVLAAAAVVVATGNPTAQELFVYLTVTALSVNAVVSSRKDASSKWNKYEITMPLRRKEIIQCKYLSYGFWVMAGTAFALVITVVTLILHKGSNLPYGVSNLFSVFVLGIGISILTGSLFYPLSYLAGIEKSETILFISILSAIGISIAVLNLLNRFLDSAVWRILLFMAFYLVLFGISYLLTYFIYSKKEF